MAKKKKTDEEKMVKLVNGTRCYFNHWLTWNIGANWGIIKDELYEAGYSAQEVNDYRDELVEQFKNWCKDRNLIWKI